MGNISNVELITLEKVIRKKATLGRMGTSVDFCEAILEAEVLPGRELYSKSYLSQTFLFLDASYSHLAALRSPQHPILFCVRLSARISNFTAFL